MEYPHHHRHHHQRRDDDDDEDRRQPPPPPQHNNFTDGPPQPHFDPYDAPPPPQFTPYAPSPAAAPYRSEPHAPPPYQSEPRFQSSYAPAPAPSPYRSEPYLEAPAPPPSFGGQVSHVGHHSSNESYQPEHQRYPPANSSLGSHEAPAPPSPFGGQVSHVGHHSSNESYPPEHHGYGGYPPANSSLGSHEDHSGVTHVTHHGSNQSYAPPSGFDHRSGETRVPDNLAGLAGRSTVKVYSKAEPDYYLTIRNGKVILAPADPSDEAQHWYKDEKYSTRVKDEEGLPCFALVNKATGEAVKHSVGATHPVHLTKYDPDTLDESVLWTESKDLGDGYRKIRMVNNVRLNMDAFHGDKKSGGVRDGTTIVLWDWNKGDNQRWKIFPFCKLLLTFYLLGL